MKPVVLKISADCVTLRNQLDCESKLNYDIDIQSTIPWRATGVSGTGLDRNIQSMESIDLNKICPIGRIPCPGECIFADIMDNISIGIVLFDLTKKIIAFENKAAVDIFGEKIKPKDYEALHSLLLSNVEEFHAPIYKSPPDILDHDGKIIGYTAYHIVKGYPLFFFLDITEKTRARHALEESETRSRLLAAAVESAAEHIVITDTEGIIQYVNPAFERITGYTRAEVVGQNPRILKSGRHNNEFYKVLWDTLNQGGVWEGHLTNKRKDGTLFEEDSVISPVKGADGEITNYVAVKRDVTEKARLEAIAGAVDTMNNIGYIFSGIRHEIGNPVNSIKVTLSVLGKKLANHPEAAVKDYLDRAMAEITRVEYLLKSLKSFNMYESLSLQDVPVRSFIEKLLDLVEKDFEEKGIRIKTIIHPDAECCYADPRALQQVMLNVLTNASDALEGEQEPAIVISVFRMKKIITIRVVDNGCGIPADYKKDLFKPLRTSKGGGTGLGLVIARKMMVQMNGAIEIESEKDAGTIVDITLPQGTDGRS